MTCLRLNRFYLTDEECKSAISADEDALTCDRFYLTDEECKLNKTIKNLVENEMFLSN